MFYLLCVLSIALLQSCGSIQPPPGGPEDKTPPEIILTNPEQRSLNVSRTTELRFVFSTPLDRPSFQSAFSITPYVNGRIEFDWSGYDEVTVILPEQLKANTTYSVQLSRDLKNRRNNTLNEPYQLIFSTGPIIDTAELLGVVFPSMQATDPLNTREIFVFGYDLGSHSPDTLNYQTTPPDYITQPDDRGVYRFLALKPGSRYRLYAVNDVFRNKVYDHGTDAYGMSTRDIRLDSTFNRDLFIRMATLPDTVQPLLQDAEVIDSLHIRARFSEAIDTQSLAPHFYRITGPEGEIPVVGVVLDRPDRRVGQLKLVLGRSLRVNSDYTLEAHIDSVTDLTGNRLIDTMRRTVFSTLETIRRADTLHIESFELQDSTRDISQLPDISMVFSDAVNRRLFESNVSLRDSSQSSVAIVFSWLDDSRVTIRPQDTLAIKQFYTLTINTVGIRSPSSYIASHTDTTLVRRFQTGDRRDNGRLSGTIRIADSLWARSTSQTLIVELTGSGTEVRQIQQLPRQTTSYTFSQVPKGKYRVRAYLSLDGSLRYDPGTVVPWHFAAPNGEFPGEVDVRPRWSVDKVDFDVR